MNWMMGLFATILFFGSVLFHEMSHSVLARRLGHPVRGITLFVFGGVSEIEEEAHTPSAEFWVAIIGPFSSFFLALLFFGSYYFFSMPSEELSAIFHRLAGINVALGVFNLFPAFPLDGGRVLRSILWKAYGSLRKATRTSGRIGQFLGYLMIITGILIAFITGRFFNGLWIAFIGWFLNGAAESSIQQVEVQRVLHGLKARDIVSSECTVVSGDLTIAELVDNYILPGSSRCFLVTENEWLAGMISVHEIKRVPKNQWAEVTVRETMRKLEMLKTADPEMEVDQVLKLMDDEKVNQVPVVEQNKLVGMITRERLLNIIRNRIALQDQK